ncbi:MAG: polysaccharide biosynthesis protein [Ruminococcaceae bacterium]|nr:polysaccharide biosynthesis protein [Oscillospiraceae bacterium]
MKNICWVKVRKIALLVAADWLALLLSLFITRVLLTSSIRFSTDELPALLATSAASLAVFAVLGYYKMSLQNAGFEEMLRLCFGTLIATPLCILINVVLDGGYGVREVIVTFLILFNFTCLTRYAYRFSRAWRYRFKGRSRRTPVMVVGAGDAGTMIVREIKASDKIKLLPVCIIDDDPQKLHTNICGVPVVGNRNTIEQMVQKHGIEQIFIAIPSARKADISAICEICARTRCRVQILPGVYQMLSGTAVTNYMRDININDLLGREPITINTREVFAYIEGKHILVTGGGGSIGSELCRQIAAHNPASLTIFDIYENNAYDIEMELRRTYPYLTLRVLIGSVRDERRVADVFAQVAPHVVFHAAAHKHVPLMENSPAEAVKNNVFGTYNVAKAASDFGVERFVMISTDKAVNPTNVMGATKRICEMIVQNFAAQSKTTDYVAVRFGNVLGSNGSVIPLFKRQISEGGPVTVTHKDIIRYFMTIPEAVSLVLQAGAYAADGEVFVLDMGEPVKIVTLAENLIRLSGYIPYKDIDITFTGLRPGEKLFEELLLDEEGMRKTPNKKIFIGNPVPVDNETLMLALADMREAAAQNDVGAILAKIKDLVPTYRADTRTVAGARPKKE